MVLHPLHDIDYYHAMLLHLCADTPSQVATPPATPRAGTPALDPKSVVLLWFHVRLAVRDYVHEIEALRTMAPTSTWSPITRASATVCRPCSST